MLTKKMTGRLGNQMFQYAGMRAIQLKIYPDEELNLDFDNLKRYGKKEDGFFNQLAYFKIDNQQLLINKKTRMSFCQKILMGKYFLKRKIIKLFSTTNSYEWKKRKYELSIQDLYNSYGLYPFSYGYYDFKKSKKKNKLFIGFLESTKFLDGMRERLVEEFQPKDPPLDSNRELYDAIGSSESVCVTIRRGDFVSTAFARSANVCDEEYFEKGISQIQQKVKKPKFFVFSDDIEWVKDNIKFPAGTMFESGNDPVWEKLRLMYSCKHFIISNSSFSWWAQYLSRNKNKVVVAPSRWRIEGYDGRELYEKDWIIIDTGDIKK